MPPAAVLAASDAGGEFAVDADAAAAALRAPLVCHGCGAPAHHMPHLRVHLRACAAGRRGAGQIVARRDAAVGAVRTAMGTGVGIPALLTAANDIVLPTVRSFAAQSVGVPAAAGAAGPSSGAPPPPTAAAIAALVASLGAQLGPLLGDGPAATVAGAAGVVARDPAVVAFLEMLREEDIARDGAADGGSSSTPAATAEATAATAAAATATGPLVVPPALLQPGASGPPVAALQRALTAVGVLAARDVAAPGAAGHFGPATTGAVARLQRDFDLDVLVPGVYDDLTAASLNSLIDARVPVAMAAGVSGAGGEVSAAPSSTAGEDVDME